jgi:hypothetical protein
MSYEPAASVRFERTGLSRPAAFRAAAIIHSAKMPFEARVGFEPTRLLHLLVFETSALNHSATSPTTILERSERDSNPRTSVRLPLSRRVPYSRSGPPLHRGSQGNRTLLQAVLQTAPNHQLVACREYPPWDSNPDARCLRPVALPIGLEGHGADDRSRTGDLHLGKVTRCQLRHIRMEPARRIELRLHPYRGCVLPLSLGRHRSGSWTRTSVRLLQGQAGMPSTHPGTNWSPRQLPPLASRPYKGRPLVGTVRYQLLAVEWAGACFSAQE